MSAEDLSVPREPYGLAPMDHVVALAHLHHGIDHSAVRLRTDEGGGHEEFPVVLQINDPRVPARENDRGLLAEIARLAERPVVELDEVAHHAVRALSRTRNVDVAVGPTAPLGVCLDDVVVEVDVVAVGLDVDREVTASEGDISHRLSLQPVALGGERLGEGYRFGGEDPTVKDPVASFVIGMH